MVQCLNSLVFHGKGLVVCVRRSEHGHRCGYRTSVLRNLSPRPDSPSNAIWNLVLNARTKMTLISRLQPTVRSLRRYNGLAAAAFAQRVSRGAHHGERQTMPRPSPSGTTFCTLRYALIGLDTQHIEWIDGGLQVRGRLYAAWHTGGFLQGPSTLEGIDATDRVSITPPS